jgi:uncharacterized phage protein (TIGR01671 family)
MRVIKFRGKRIDNGEWVAGCLIIENPPLQCFASEQDESDKYLIGKSGFADWNMHRPFTAAEVYPESVGQLIELDNKVKKVYEGDIVKAYKSNSGLDWKDDLYIVEYDTNFSQFVLRCIHSKNEYRMDKIAMKSNSQPYLLKNITEVVGNKTDNPELIN